MREKITQNHIKIIAEKLCLFIDNTSKDLRCKYNNDQPHYQTVVYQGKTSFYIRFDEHRQKIYVGADRLRSKRDDWYWSFNITTIGMSIDKSVAAIFKDIERRFLPDFFQAAQSVLQHEADHYAYLDKKDSVKDSICKAFGFIPQPNNRENVSGDIGAFWLRATINPETFDLTIQHLTPEKAQAIADVLRA